MEPLPDFATLSDDDLRTLIRDLRAPHAAKLGEKLAVTEGLLYRRGNFNGSFDQLILEAMLAVKGAEIAAKQMRGPGGMVSFVVKGGKRSPLERATAILKSLHLFACAESLGGVESLIEHPAIMTHASIPPATH